MQNFKFGLKKENLFPDKIITLFLRNSISLQPFEHPMCTKEGVIFDIL